MPSRPTLWVAVAWSWQVTSSEHLWELGCQGTAHLTTRWGGMWVVWSKQQAMRQAWGLEEGIRARFFWPQGWPTCPFSTLTSYMGTEHGVSAGVLGGDPVWAPFPVPAPRKEQATRPPPVFLRKLEPLSEHRPGVWRTYTRH